MPRNLLIVALLLPLAVIGIGIGRAEHHVANSRLWLFDVNGYDPRDLLRGHYIQFRLDLHEMPPRETCDDDSGAACCLCLTMLSADAPPQVERATCETARTLCDGALQTRFLSQLNRYYIPEQDAWKLEQDFQAAAQSGSARLRVAINKEGEPQIDGLLVNGNEILARDP